MKNYQTSIRIASVPPPEACARIRVYNLVIVCYPDAGEPFHLREMIATEGRAEEAALAAVAIDNQVRAENGKEPIEDYEIEEAVLMYVYRSTVPARPVVILHQPRPAASPAPTDAAALEAMRRAAPPVTDPPSPCDSPDYVTHEERQAA